MPSSMLEQDAQALGSRDNAFPPSGISSPQHMQMRGFIFCSLSFVGIQYRLHSRFPKVQLVPRIENYASFFRPD
jgi:hypothetical protein